MNITLGNGKAVHAAYRDGVRNPACGGNRATDRYQGTDADVTCKRCLKLVAAQEEAADRTAYYTGLSDQQDMDLSQAETADDEAVDWDPRTGLPIVTVDGTRHVVGRPQRAATGRLSYVNYWPAGPADGFNDRHRAFEGSEPGTLARAIWDAQQALR